MNVSKCLIKSGGIVALLTVLAGGTAKAEIKDYEMRRFILYKTECHIDELSKEATKDGGLNFLAKCQNEALYPDGLRIKCGDGNNANSCKVKTEPTTFQLELLQKKD